MATEHAAAPTARTLHRITADILGTFDWRTPSWLAYWGTVGLCAFVWSLAALVWAYQIYTGLHITGMTHPVMWGFYITAFVFWIGIAHSGTLIAAILFLFRAEWRTSVARAAETMTIVAVITAGLFPILHLGRSWRFYWLIPYPNERGLWINFSSPLIWDAFAVGTYFVVSVLFWYVDLIPDFATVRDHSAGWQQRVFRWLAIGWAGTAAEWKHWRTAYTLLAGLVTALVVSVHSIVSWDFAVAVVPGWHSTIFAPYFVAGAIFSGLAMVLTLMIPGRYLLGITEYLTVDHLEKIAKLVLAMSLILTYSYASELFFAWSRGDAYERAQFLFRLRGAYAPLFWLTIVCNSLVPLLFFRRSIRRNLTLLFAMSVLINIGMWSERLMIITGSLAHEYNAYSWGSYWPTAFEWTIIAGSAAWFLFWFLLIIGHVPSVPIADTRQQALTSEGPRLDVSSGPEAIAVRLTSLRQGYGGPPERSRGRKPDATPVGADSARIVAYFESPSQLEHGADVARRAGWRTVTACAPTYNETVLRVANVTRSSVAIAALAGGIAGLLFGALLTIGTVRQWPGLIVSGKPLVSMPPFLIIMFELTILFASLAAVSTFLLDSIRARRAAGPACDAATSDDRFSLLLEAAQADAGADDDFGRRTGASEWRRV